jgi:hypothetical protein
VCDLDKKKEVSMSINYKPPLSMRKAIKKLTEKMTRVKIKGERKENEGEGEGEGGGEGGDGTLTQTHTYTHEKEGEEEEIGTDFDVLVNCVLLSGGSRGGDGGAEGEKER